MLNEGLDGEIEEQLAFKAYTRSKEEKTKTFWLKNMLDNVQPESVKLGWEAAFGKNISVYETANTTTTKQVVTKIDAQISKQEFESNGDKTLDFNAIYENTDYTNPNIKLRMILEIAK